VAFAQARQSLYFSAVIASSRETYSHDLNVLETWRSGFGPEAHPPGRFSSTRQTIPAESQFGSENRPIQLRAGIVKANVA
jgi:hypothetical protein